MVGSISSRPRSSRLSLRSKDVRTDSTGTDSPLSNRNSRPIEDKVEGRRSVIQQRLSTLNAITEEEPDSGSPRTRSAPPPRRSVLIPPTNVNGLTPPRLSRLQPRNVSFQPEVVSSSSESIPSL